MRGLAALFALWLAVLLPARAMAEDLRPQPVPAVLTDVRLLADTPGETRLRLEFAPRPNSWAPIDSGADARPDPRQSAIGFALTTRANSAVAPPGLKGLVRAISFDQADSVLILRFSAS
ncbi:MAG TPA: hypothetical protein VFF94_15100, partial [Novosphingobium sp.]|nr:hypothetical protein [Novosphingobium sp.]